MLTKQQKEQVLEAMGFKPFYGIYTMYKSVWRDLKTGRLYSSYRPRFGYQIGVEAKVSRPAPESYGQCTSGIHVSTQAFAKNFLHQPKKGHEHYGKKEAVILACQFHIDEVIWAGSCGTFYNWRNGKTMNKPIKRDLPNKIRVKRVLPIGFLEGHGPKGA